MNNMSTLEKLYSIEKEVLNFIETNTDVSDFVLKREFKSNETLEFLRLGLYDVIDNIIYDNKIHHVYLSDSQVPFYELCNK